jgi:hypothetical protein
VVETCPGRRVWAKRWFPARTFSLAALSLVLTACSSYRSGGPARSVCLTIRIDYAGADVYDDITVAKMIDPPTGLTVYGGMGSAVTYNQAPSRGMLLVTRECFSVSSTGTKKLIAFYRPGVTEPRPECEGVANLFSSRCMPAPGDIVAETYVDIEEGSDLVVNMKMGESE